MYVKTNTLIIFISLTVIDFMKNYSLLDSSSLFKKYEITVLIITIDAKTNMSWIDGFNIDSIISAQIKISSPNKIYVPR